MNTLNKLVGAPGFEPRTYRLKAGCSEPIELCPPGFWYVVLSSIRDSVPSNLHCRKRSVGVLQITLVDADGFEPPRPRRAPGLQPGSFNRSDTHPICSLVSIGGCTFEHQPPFISGGGCRVRTGNLLRARQLRFQIAPIPHVESFNHFGCVQARAHKGLVWVLSLHAGQPRTSRSTIPVVASKRSARAPPKWSRQRGSNPRLSRWQRTPLPT